MATTRKPRTTRSTRTRSELAAELDDVTTTEANTDQPTVQGAALAREHASKIRGATADISVDSIVSKSSMLSLEISRTFDALKEQCVSKAAELETLKEAVILETSELERLYKLDVVAASTAELLKDHEEQKSTLEKQMNDVRASWAEELASHNKSIRERDQALQKERAREQEEYSYKIQTERNYLTDQFTEQLRLKKRENDEALAAFNKDIAVRNAELVAREQEFTAYKTRIASIEEEIKKAAAAQVAIATGALKKDLTNDHTIALKDKETSLQLQQQKNASLTEANTLLAEQITKLQTQLEAAREAVTKTAADAFNAVSGQQALQKVQETVRDNGTARGSKS